MVLHRLFKKECQVLIMGRSIVILQPQYFPWIGVFEQIKLADVYVHYDDVQYPQGRSFMNRVQIKAENGQQWMTVPIIGSGMQNINEKIIDDGQNWSHKHRESFRHNYSAAPYVKDAIEIMDDVFSRKHTKISDLNIYALEKISAYFSLKTEFIKSSELRVKSSSTERLIEICNHFAVKKYITGMGAKNYINYNLFEDAGIKLHYMDYKKLPYNQLYGDFIPYVSILDLIANCGKEGAGNISSGTTYWQNTHNLKEV